MNKSTIAIFFTILFAAMLVMPVIIMAVDSSVEEVSIFYSTGEEEKESEKNKNLEIDVFQTDQSNNSDVTLDEDTTLEYFFKKPAALYLKLHSPPPEILL